MGSRIKSLLFGKSSINNNRLRGQSYDTAVASDPPVKGSYPVAGNGPNVLEDLNRSRIKRQSLTHSPAPPPIVPLHRNNATERPRTAPHNGMPGGGTSASVDAGGRTRSGFSMKSPPAFFSSRRNSVASVKSSRRNSLQKLQKPPPLPPNAFPASTPQGNRTKEIRTYVPTNGSTSTPSRPPNSFTPYAQQLHNRSASHATYATNASHKSYVDLLDAHSTIDRSREASRHRTKASGLRDYGEDVADRNIADFGEKADKGLDLNSPEFSYLKQVYRPKKKGATKSRTEPYSRVDSALGHVLGSDGSSDDTPPQTQSSQRPTSIRSFTAPRPGFAYPPRRDSRSPRATSTSLYDDDPSNGVQERRGRAMSPLSSNPTTIHEPQPQDRRQRSVISSRAVSTPPISERGEGRPGTVAAVKAFVEPTPPAAPSVKVTSPPQSRPSSSQSEMVFGLRAKSKRRSVSGQGKVPPLPDTNGTAANSNAVAAAVSAHGNSINGRGTAPATNGVSPPINGGTYRPTKMMNSSNNETRMPATNGTRSRSTSYSAFPSDPRESQNSDLDTPLPAMVPTGSAQGNRRDMIVSGASEPQSLDGVVDLKDSVDTDVTTKTQHAIIHEHVLPTRHEIREERITREIHTHDVYHRILPVIETEILPTKHYIPSSDGRSLIEIPESQVPNHTITGTVPNNWHIASGLPPRDPPRGPLINLLNQHPLPHNQNQIEDDDELAADPPIIGLARGEPKNRSRSNTAKSHKSHKSQRSSGSPSKPILEPFLSSKRESVTKEGIPRTEYVWRHPPVFETADGKTTPAYIPAAFGQPSNSSGGGRGAEPEFYSYSSDEEDAAGAEFGAEKAEGDLLFRDSGYGGGGMLPGLVDRTPTAIGKEKVTGGRLRRESDIRRKGVPGAGLEGGMKSLNLR